MSNRAGDSFPATSRRGSGDMFDMLAQSDLVQMATLYGLPLTGSTLLAYGIYQAVHDLRKPEQKKVEQRLKERSPGAHGGRNEMAAHESILRQQKAASSTIQTALSRLKFIPWLQRSLDQANLPWIATAFIVNMVGLGAAVYLGLYLLDSGFLVRLVSGIVAALLPLLFVVIKRKWRINKLLNQLPDVFDMMGQALRAGHSLPSAIHVVSQQLPDPCGTEFARIFYEQNLGIKIEEAMLNMAGRVELLDVRMFVTAVLIQRTTGGDLAEVLDNIGGVIRERIKLFGLVKALTAEGRLSGWVLFALPFIVFALEQVINPEYGRVLIETRLGQYMLAGALTAQLLGLAMIKKIVNIKV